MSPPHAELSDMSSSLGGAEQLGTCLKLLEHVCSITDGPSPLARMLETVENTIKMAEGAERVCP